MNSAFSLRMGRPCFMFLGIFDKQAVLVWLTLQWEKPAEIKQHFEKQGILS